MTRVVDGQAERVSCHVTIQPLPHDGVDDEADDDPKRGSL